MGQVSPEGDGPSQGEAGHEGESYPLAPAQQGPGSDVEEAVHGRVMELSGHC